MSWADHLVVDVHKYDCCACVCAAVGKANWFGQVKSSVCIAWWYM